MRRKKSSRRARGVKMRRLMILRVPALDEFRLFEIEAS